MLNSFCKGACATAAILTLWAGVAHADNVEVLIVDGSYFPSIIYASHGDNIIFRNRSDASHTVSGPDGSWTSEVIPTEGFYRLNLTRNTPTTFSGSGGGLEEAVGEIIFSEAPAVTD